MKINFHDGVRSRINGVAVGDYLVVASGSKGQCIYKVSNKRDGRGKAIKIEFTSRSDAIEFAETINKMFADYLPIWDAYPKANIFSWAKWHSYAHLRAFCLIDILDNLDMDTPITLASLSNEKISRFIDKRISWWTRDSNWDHDLSGKLGVI